MEMDLFRKLMDSSEEHLADEAPTTAAETTKPKERLNNTTETPTVTPQSIIKLTIGDVPFTSKAGQLMKYSDYFQRLFSEPWAHNIEYDEDGYIYIQKDGDLFAHIMNYICDGVFPLFYNTTGHDLAKYIRLLEHAQYFGVTGLIDWLKNERYYEVVRHRYREHDYYADADEGNPFDQDVNSRKTLDFHTLAYNEMVYVCPRDIAVHRGAPQKCGQQCAKARERLGKEDYVDEEKHKVIVVSKETCIDMDKCIEKRAF